VRCAENGTESNNFLLVLELVISVQHHLKVYVLTILPQYHHNRR
jgi:hypothetical protein